MDFELDSALASDFLCDVVSDIDCVRESSSLALTNLLQSDRSHISSVIELAMQAYQDKLYVSIGLYVYVSTTCYI